MSDESDDDFDPQELAVVRQNKLDKLKEAGDIDDEVIALGDHTNNKVGMLAKLEEIKQENLPWIERLDFTTGAITVDAHDDLKREAEFYTQSLRGVHTAIIQLDQARIPYVRPGDFFAEMIKPDTQMRKIKDSLLKERLKMETVANRIKQKSSKKFQRKVHAERLEQKAQEKRDGMAAFKKSKAGNIHNEFKVERSMVGTIDDALKRKQSGDGKVNKKRQRANSKYGFGGKKKYVKRNDGESAANPRNGFSVAKNRQKAGLSMQKPGSRKKKR